MKNREWKCWNKVNVEAELITKGPICGPKDQNTDTSAHHEVNKDQDTEAIYHPEVPEDLDVDKSAHTEVHEDHEVPFHGSRYEINTQNTPEYVRTMYIYVKILITMIRIQGLPSTSQLVHLIL